MNSMPSIGARICYPTLRHRKHIVRLGTVVGCGKLPRSVRVKFDDLKDVRRLVISLIHLMTPPLSPLRLLVAEACGWLNLHPSGRLDGQIVGTNPKLPVIGKYEAPPDYPTSLDACAEFEAGLKPHERDIYAGILCDILNPCRIVGYGDPENGSPQLAWPGVWQVATATPEQRCRAFLAVKGVKMP